MTSSYPIKEIFFLRSIACLGVVLVHAIAWSFAYETAGELSGNAILSLEYIKLLFMFSTPVFVFISELLLAHSYRGGLPEKFFKKRITYILLPYLSMAIIFAVETSLSSGLTFSQFLVQSASNIFLGTFLGYFVLVIFQFYLLHYFFGRALQTVSPGKLLGISFAVNLAYLSFFNFVDPFPIPYGDFIWFHLSWLPFPGWIFYFSLGYCIGSDFEKVIKKLPDFKVLILLLPILSGGIVVLMNHYGYITVSSSKRADILLYSSAMIFFLLYIGGLIQKMPRPIMLLSRYSFGIYLLHPIFLAMITVAVGEQMTYFLYLAITYFGSILLSILTAFLLNKTKYGFVLAGKPGKNPYKHQHIQENRENPYQKRAL
ncbi:acyltransferase family protein [Bacillus lacus]|uniref:Acyltransferase family protein n=1 Tax=Metabacillus lacus TaxID=1983721 RepID=A0A7X2J2G2_9BACI|nr:acyltransferase family protein [Metabacillus lacus]MRX74126.1 acyltransferase family protein [Metabacillus lacus]